MATSARARAPLIPLAVVAAGVTGIAACHDTPTSSESPIGLRPTLSQVDLPYQITPPAVSLLRADQLPAWVTGAGVTIGIIDDGFEATHEDLSIASCVPTSQVPNPCGVFGQGHGTLVAGVVRARDNSIGIKGVAPAVSLSVCGQGSGYESAIDCIYSMANSGVEIISISWPSGDIPELRSAIQYAFNQKGLLVFAEADNRWNHQAAPTTVFPAAWPEVIGVSGVMPDRRFADHDFTTDLNAYHGFCPPYATQQNGDLLASEWGDASNHGSYVELAGPYYTTSTAHPFPPEFPGRYRHVCGTSFATPAVAAVAALVWQANPNLTNVQVRDILRNSAEPAGAPGYDEYYGYGIVDAKKAFGLARPDLIDHGQSTVTVDKSTMYANGVDVTTVTITMRNHAGNGMPGVVPKMVVSGYGNTISHPGPTNASGVTTGSFTTTVGGTKVVTAQYWGNLPQTPSVNAIAPIEVNVVGPYEVPHHGSMCNWYAQVSGGSSYPQFVWEWDGQVVSYYEFYVLDGASPGAHWLTVTVTDDANQTVTRGVVVDVIYDPFYQMSCW